MNSYRIIRRHIPEDGILVSESLILNSGRWEACTHTSAPSSPHLSAAPGLLQIVIRGTDFE
jgi:hypothetical protein